MSHAKNRRRTLIVNKEAQRRIVMAISLFPAISLALATMIIAVFCRKLLGEAERADASLPSLVPLFFSVLGFVLVSGLIVFHQAVKFSNKIAGPSYRLMRAFAHVKDGDFTTRIGLRKGDHLVELADAFNDFVEWLKEHPPKDIEEIRETVQAEIEAEREADRIAAEGGDGETGVEVAEPAGAGKP